MRVIKFPFLGEGSGCLQFESVLTESLSGLFCYLLRQSGPLSFYITHSYICCLDVRKSRRFVWQERGESRKRLRKGIALLRYKSCGQNTWTCCTSLLILITRLSTATVNVSLWSDIHTLSDLCSLSCLETQTREFLMMGLTQQSHLSPASPFKCNSTSVRQNPDFTQVRSTWLAWCLISFGSDSFQNKSDKNDVLHTIANHPLLTEGCKRAFRQPGKHGDEGKPKEVQIGTWGTSSP